MALGLAQNRRMNSYPDPQTQAGLETEPVVYEQPLNERMRTFLRLEFLYTQASYHSELPNPWSSRAAVASLLEILAITARGDSRSEVLKELERHVNVLKEAGFLKLRKEGTRYNYSIDRDFLKRVNESFGEYLDHRNVECGQRRGAAC